MVAGNMTAMSGFKKLVMCGTWCSSRSRWLSAPNSATWSISSSCRLSTRCSRSRAARRISGNLTFTLRNATFAYGAFLTDALSFLISALVVYFVLVMPVTRLIQLFERNQAATSRDCPECTMSIPVAARRCPECTADITPGTERRQQVSA